MQKRCNGAKRNGIFSKCLHWICKYYAFQRNATTPNSPIMAKSHPAGMHICYGIFAGISLRLCSISLRSITSFLHTCLHTSNPYGIFLQSSLNIQGQLVNHPLYLKDRIELLRERRSCDFFLLLRLFLFKLGVVLGGNLGEIVNFVG